MFLLYFIPALGMIFAKKISDRNKREEGQAATEGKGAPTNMELCNIKNNPQ